MLLWGLITLGALVAAVAFRSAYEITVRHHRSAWVRRPKPGICFYLDEDNAMDLYLQGDYPYLQRTIQETTRRNTAGELLVRFSPVRGGVKRAVGEEQVTKYFEDVGPITVIGRIIRALDRANDIVYVDLFNRTLGPTASLDQVLKLTHGKQAKRVAAARLRDLESDAFVSVEGRFRVTAKSETMTTFSAPYGDPDEPSSDLPGVSVTCDNEQLRRIAPDGPFRARCLGKISWNPGTRQLEIAPVLAIFQ